jgi:two-component system LytT family response regulator
MNVVLIEDEAIAMRMLRKIILTVDGSTEIITQLDSVAEAKKWFSDHKDSEIDVVFSDISLSDGLSFEIFESLQLQIPVIFTTAYNEYAIKAFKVNGIDYLLKPIQEDEVRAAMNKIWHTKTQISKQQLHDIQQLILKFQSVPVLCYPTFLAFQKDKIIPVKSENVAWLFINNQVFTAVLLNNQKLHLEETMDAVEKRLPKTEFFKINRQYIVSRKAIVEAEYYFNNRLALKLSPPATETVVVSRERVSQFRNWLQGII